MPEQRDRSAAGGPDSAQAVLGAYTGLVRGFFARRCASPEDVEDLAQEALCAIIGGLGRFRGESSPPTWVYAICRNVFMNWLEAKERASRIEVAVRGEASLRGESAQGGAELLDPLLDLESALASLSPSEKKLYEFYYREGRRVRELAAILGKPEGTVKYLLSRLRSRIGELLS